MSFKRVLVVGFYCALAFGQTAQDNYRKAKAAEFRSDHAVALGEKQASISDALDLMVDAAAADGQYVESFAVIARKYIVRHSSPKDQPYFYMYDTIIKLGKVRANDPAYKSLMAEVFNGYKTELAKRGFTPSKPFAQVVQGRNRLYCNVPMEADQIYHISLFAYPRASVEVKAWGKYAADLHMTPLKGCGGEGSDTEPDPDKAFPIYSFIGDAAGTYKTGKMLGDRFMEDYLFGGTDWGDEKSIQHDAGYRPFYEKSMKFYHGSSVDKANIRSTILRLLRKAEKDKYSEATIGLAKKTLAETF